MGRTERAAYLRVVRGRYKDADRAKKTEIVTEVATNLGWHCKSVIRAIARPQVVGKKAIARRKRWGRPSRVTDSDRVVLGRIAKGSGWPCGKRLVAMLPLWLPHDEQRHGIYETGQRERLLSLSAATLDRHLRPARKAAGIRGRSGTKPGSMLRTQIPIRSGPWDVDRPGYLEMDTVAHCGHSLSGQFMWSLTVTDIHTTWTETRPVWNKLATGVRDALEDIDRALPFTIRGLDADNGSEFINKFLVRYLEEHPDKPSFTRSRPYHKNDNAHVEQKNWTHVRQHFGYARIDDRAQLGFIEELCRNELSQLHNFFCPTMKLLKHERIGAKKVKRYDKPKAPLDRLIETDLLSEQQKQQLLDLRNSIDPFQLRLDIEAKIRHIFNAAR